MNRLVLASVLLLCTAHFGGYGQIIFIKYNPSDCISCNLYLNDGIKKAQCPILIALPSNTQPDSGLINLVRQSGKSDISIRQSDSIYHLYDNADATKALYVDSSGALLYSDYIKNWRGNRLYRPINSDLPIAMDTLEQGFCISDCITFIDRSHHGCWNFHYNSLSDSTTHFSADLEDVRRKTYQIYYGSQADKFAQRIAQMNSVVGNDKAVRLCQYVESGDSAVAVFATRGLLPSTGSAQKQTIVELPLIRVYKAGKETRTLSADLRMLMIGGKTFSPVFTSIRPANSRFCCRITGSEAPDSTTPLFAEFREEGNQLVFDKAIAYSIEPGLFNKELKYILTGMAIQSGNYISNVYSNRIYDLKNEISVELPFESRNEFTLQEAMGDIEADHEIRSILAESDHSFRVLIWEEERYAILSYKKVGRKYKLLQRQNLGLPEKGHGYGWYTYLTSNGVVTYRPEERQFVRYLLR